MKITGFRITVIASLLILIILALPSRALSSPLPELVISETYTLTSGQILEENITIVAGTVTLEAGSIVRGNILVIGGNLLVSGRVEGNITATGGSIRLEETAYVEGDITTAGATLNQQDGAVVEGEIRTEHDSSLRTLPGGVQVPSMGVTFDPFFHLLGFVLRTGLWALLSMLVAMFLPRQIERVASTVVSLPVTTGGLGLLTILVLPLVLVVIGLTIILLPVTLLGLLAGILAWAFGLAALSSEVGRRIGLLFKQEWHPAIAAGVGALLLFLTVDGLAAVIPCLGWLPRLLIGSLGLGSVMLTRFGGQIYPSEPALIPAQEQGGAV